MKVIYGNAVQDARGKNNGNVYSKNRYGAYVRTKVTPVNRRTSFQTAVRAAFTAFSTAWSATLTEAQRQSFSAFAALHAFTNIFGEKRFLDGKAMYIKLNTALSNGGLAAVTAPPVDITTGSTGALTLTATVAAGGALSLATVEAGIPVGAQLNIYATALQSNGKNFIKSELRFISSPAAGASPYNIKAAWIAKFGAFPTVAGGKIFVAVQVLTTEGWLSVPASTFAFVS